MYQMFAWQLGLFFVAVLFAALLCVVSHARESADDRAPSASRGCRLRATLLWAVLLPATPVTLYALLDLPYANAAADRQRAAQIIDVVGRQWTWALGSSRATVGTPVEFRVSSDDVNHGLGIYDADMRLIARTTAVPGHTSTLRHTFTQPGTYRLLCLEYCGRIHHSMIAEFHVDTGPEYGHAYD